MVAKPIGALGEPPDLSKSVTVMVLLPGVCMLICRRMFYISKQEKGRIKLAWVIG